MGRCLRSGCDNHPSILGKSLHHVLVRASGRTVAKSRTGQRSFVGPSFVSEEAAQSIGARISPGLGSRGLVVMFSWSTRMDV